MKSRTRIIAIASALVLAQATWALAQTAPGGPAPNTSQSPTGGLLQSTTPPATQGPGATSSSGTVGQSRRPTQLEDPKQDPVVRETEQEVSRRIKSICKGC
jgi:hypothetical protein